MFLPAVMVLVTLVSQGVGAHQRRNWTPQAVLYLKGTQGRRSRLEHDTRQAGDLHSVTDNQGMRPELSFASLFDWELQRQGVEKGGDVPDHYPDEQEGNNLRL